MKEITFGINIFGSSMSELCIQFRCFDVLFFFSCVLFASFYFFALFALPIHNVTEARNIKSKSNRHRINLAIKKWCGKCR